MATLQKRQSVPGPYSQMIRRLQGRMKQLQDEMAVESVTNIEFEEASRKTFDSLTAQVKTLKEAFNTLTDALLQELDGIGNKVDEKLNRITNTKSTFEASIVSEVSQVASRQSLLEGTVSQLSRDVDNMLSIIPKLEDKIEISVQDLAKASETAVLAERVDRLSEDIPARDAAANSAHRALASTERLEAKLCRLESDLREELDQRHLKHQRNISRQLESMSKVLVESTAVPPSGVGNITSPLRRGGADHDASPTFSGGGLHSNSARREAPSSVHGSLHGSSPTREALRNLRLT